MASTFFGLDIGTTGLFAAQTGLNTTAHNIANTETIGFSRQKVNQKAGNALRTNNSYGMIGSGVTVTGITQERELYYDEKYWSNNALYGLYNTRDYFMTEVEGYLNEIELQGFTSSFNSMYDSIQELTKHPESLTVRTNFTNSAMSLCEYFNSLSTSLTSVQEECNFEVRNQVDKINSLTGEIATLTKQINSVEIGGDVANDLRDQRALLVDKLSEIVNTTVSEKKVGEIGKTEYTVRINGQIIVDTYETRTLKCVPRDDKMNQTDADGLYDIVWEETNQEFVVNDDRCKGNLKALIELRDGNNADNLSGKLEKAVAEGDTEVTLSSSNINDEVYLNIPKEGMITVKNAQYKYSGFEVSVDPDSGEYKYTFKLDEPVRRDAEAGTETKVGLTVDYKGIPYYMAKLNQFIRTFARAFNNTHTQGKDLKGNDGEDFFTTIDSFTGKEKSFAMDKQTIDGKEYLTFNSNTGSYYNGSKTYTSYYELTAASFTVNDAINHDSRLVVTGSTIADGVANADIAEKLLALKEDKLMFNQGGPAAFLQTLVAEVGVDCSSSKNFAKSQSNIIKSVSNQRLSVSGVDTEEEGMNLVRYQSAYKHASKVISVMNEIYDKLINYMGV
ncbi:MAG: flagellar hook-associated protein FlgK [Lachnospiraceae bacterium]|nr:flagellar hook-associated protein FlgK [Lachnospiraceae bacterium]